MSYVSPTNSKILYATRPHVAADGTTAAVIKVRLRDHENNPVANRQAQLYSANTNITITQPGLTNVNGLALAYVRSSTPGQVTISARVLPEA
jgi:hypothetical protein